jgi:hypothetical protein
MIKKVFIYENTLMLLIWINATYGQRRWHTNSIIADVLSDHIASDVLQSSKLTARPADPTRPNEVFRTERTDRGA